MASPRLHAVCAAYVYNGHKLRDTFIKKSRVFLTNVRNQISNCDRNELCFSCLALHKQITHLKV